MQHLLNRDVEVYQDILIGGELAYKGERNCDDRYQIIKEHIAEDSVVMDVGSAYGYFGIQLARDLNVLTWSFESDPIRQLIQKAVIHENREHRVLLSGYVFGSSVLDSLSESVETVDTIIALSVFHYLPVRDLRPVMKKMSEYAPNLIIELASSKEKVVANKHLIDELEIMDILADTYDRIEFIGETTSSKDPDVLRPIYKCSMRRVNRSAYGYIGGENGRMHNILYQNGIWSIDGNTDIVAGINLHNLISSNLVYPKRDLLIHGGAMAYHELMQASEVTDIRTWNLLYTQNGIIPIDTHDKGYLPPPGENMQSYRERIKNLDEVGVYHELMRGL